MIVLDTLSRTMTGDENSPADMAAYVAGCDSLREKTGAAVVVLHHEGKDASRGPMGHTKLRGALDTSVRVHRDNAGNVRVEIVDQRNGPADLSLLFSIEAVGRGPVLRPIKEGTEKEFLASETLDVLAAQPDGTSLKEVKEAVARAFNIGPEGARKRIDKELDGGEIIHQGKRIWVKKLDPKNPRGAGVLRVVEASG